jgi:hypothetical protein
LVEIISFLVSERGRYSFAFLPTSAFAPPLHTSSSAEQISKQHLTSFFEHDGSSHESVHMLLLLLPLLEVDGMLQFEIEIVVIGVRSETNFF